MLFSVLLVGLVYFSQYIADPGLHESLDRSLKLGHFDRIYLIDLSFIGTALAASHGVGSNSGVAGIIPYVLGAIFVLMILAFAVCLWFLLATPDKPENERRLTTADNVVKTFGGFFIGFITSMLNIS